MQAKMALLQKERDTNEHWDQQTKQKEARTRSTIFSMERLTRRHSETHLDTHLLTSQHLLVLPTGQFGPTEVQTCWPGKYCPLVGLVLTDLLLVSGSQFLLEEWMMRAGSSRESARGCLTKSSRLVDLWSSSNSFYGLNSSGLIFSMHPPRRRPHHWSLPH